MLMSKSRAAINELAPRVDIGGSITADYVVAHAARQRQRGRKPSVAYRGIANPREALKQAKADIAERSADPQRAWEGKADYSGRVAVVHVLGEQLMAGATAFAEEMMDDNGAVGAIVRVPDMGVQLPFRLPHAEGGVVEVKYGLTADSKYGVAAEQGQPPATQALVA
jgi:hypothetical protein